MVAIAAALRQSVGTFRGQEWDKLSHPYGIEGLTCNGQDLHLGGVGVKSWPLIWREKEHPMWVEGVHMGGGYGLSMAMWVPMILAGLLVGLLWVPRQSHNFH